MFFVKDRDLPLWLQYDYPVVSLQTLTRANTNSALSTLSAMSMTNANNYEITRQLPAPFNITVAQALEYARDSEEGARDSTVGYVLQTAVQCIWDRIQAEPSSYVLTREEFAVFNYFQDQYQNQLAAAARKRYWDQARQVVEISRN